MTKQINDEILLAGDILLTTTNAPVSGAIRAFTKSDISHAMIYVEKCSVIDATQEGVQARNTHRIFIDDDCTVFALRLKDPLPKQKAMEIVDYARNQVGAQYSTSEAMLAAFGGISGWTKKQFCSRLVAQAYDSAGFKIVSDPNYCSPEDIRRSPYLVNIEPSTCRIDKRTREEAEQEFDLTRLMRESTNYLLNGVRKRDASIQGIHEIDDFLMRNPKEDEYVLGLYVDSGYLDVWKLEMAARPFHYDANLFESHPDSDQSKRNYCFNVVTGFEEGIRRYEKNYSGYASFYKKFGFRTFFALMNLYDNLLKMQNARFHVAKEWLCRHQES